MRDPIVDGRATSAHRRELRRPCATPKSACPSWPANFGRYRKGDRGFPPNYDNSLEEPAVLPTKGESAPYAPGHRVGMATNIPPHNLGELCDGLLCFWTSPAATCTRSSHWCTVGFSDRRRHIRRQGPDGCLYHRSRQHQDPGKAEIEEGKKGQQPWSSGNPLCLEQVLPGRKDRRPHQRPTARRRFGSARRIDRKGIRIVLDLRRGTIADIVINALYKSRP